ncbi:MAG TPA: hypothetical protein VK971_12440 [Thiohalobacter sp.]|nr:hypothetical protein [Thiohalobacter sp.]
MSRTLHLAVAFAELETLLNAAHALNCIRDCRGRRDYDAAFGTRMRGTGIFAGLLAQRFTKACRWLDFPGAPPLGQFD